MLYRRLLHKHSLLIFKDIAQFVQILRVQILVADAPLRVQLHRLAIADGIFLPMRNEFVVRAARRRKSRPRRLNLLYKIGRGIRHQLRRIVEGKRQVNRMART